MSESAPPSKSTAQEIEELKALVAGLEETNRSLQERATRGQDERERWKLERKLLHTQKLESLGVLAQGIAHDFNNQLMVILGNANLVLTDGVQDPRIVESVREIETAAQRAAELTAQMLAFSGKSAFMLAPVDLAQLVHQSLPMIQASMAQPFDLRSDLPDALALIHADASQIQEVLMALMSNSCEAMDDDTGVMTVRVGVMRIDSADLREIVLGGEIAEGEYVLLEIVDNGVGMDAGILGKIFEPFFSTKFVGRGMGLAAVLGIMRSHSGAIQVFSRLGEGTTVRLLFPIWAEQPKSKPSVILDDDDWGVGKSVLVVDDENGILEVARKMLERRGFRVLTVDSGRKAMEVFARGKDEIVAVLLDRSMPEMDGLETLQQIRRIRQDACVILTSGYDEEEARRGFEEMKLDGFIHKPYRRNALVDAIRRAAEDHSSGA